MRRRHRYGRSQVSETARLRKLQQQPAHAQRLLHALVVSANLVPEGAHQIRVFASVPKELRIIAALAATTNGHVWSCWTHEGTAWLFIGELSLPQSRARGLPVLLVHVYDEAGPKDSGLWAYSEGMWQRCADSLQKPQLRRPQSREYYAHVRARGALRWQTCPKSALRMSRDVYGCPRSIP